MHMCLHVQYTCVRAFVDAVNLKEENRFLKQTATKMPSILRFAKQNTQPIVFKLNIFPFGTLKHRVEIDTYYVTYFIPIVRRVFIKSFQRSFIIIGF